MKIIISLVFIISFLSLSYTQDCSSPLDCYLKAYQMLQKDREDMRNLKTVLEELIYNKTQIIEDKVNQRVTNITNQMKEDYERKIEDIKKSTSQQLDVMTLTIKKLYEDIDNLKQANRDRHYLFKDAIVYHDMIDTLEKGVIFKMGNPSGWDDTTYRVNLWNNRKMIRIGMNSQDNGNGLKTIIPQGYNVLWLRVANHVWNIFRVKFLDNQQEDIGKFSCGKRGLNEYSPDGTSPDTNDRTHMWCQISTGRSGQIAVYTDRDTDGWISGIAFGKNLWNHTRNSALAYHWMINGGSPTNWENDNWNGDILSYIPQGKTTELIVPVVYSGNDKLLYFVEHNANWHGTLHTNIYVNDVLIERLRTSYDNPFARHYNSKPYDRYVAARIPKDLIKPDAKFISVKIDMNLSGNHIYVRDIGTHDFLI